MKCRPSWLRAHRRCDTWVRKVTVLPSLRFEHGAPLRLRLENQLGFKMVKWIRSVEFVDEYAHIGLGQGGWREDHQFYSRVVGI